MRGIRSAVAVSALAAAALAAACTTPAGAQELAVPRPDRADVRACGALPKFPKGTVAQLMAGRLRIAPFKAVTVDPRRDGASTGR
jgi:hypothetical protein